MNGELYRPRIFNNAISSINLFGRSGLIVGLQTLTSNRREHYGPKVTLMTNSFCTSVGSGRLRNVGLPKSRETHGNGVLVVVDKKDEEGQPVNNVEEFCAVGNNGIELLKQLADSNFSTVKNIYRIVCCEKLLIAEYGSTKSKVGNMTKGTDGKTYDGMKHEIGRKLTNELITEKYKPAPVRRVNIPKSNGMTRPLGIQSINDKLVQGVVKKVLEAIYDKTFSKYSHGFRPNRGVHTAMKSIQS